jgi:hypothetical protein
MRYGRFAAVVALMGSPAIAQIQPGTPGTAFRSSATVPPKTETDARNQFEAAGYSVVSGLRQNSDGSWSASASKGGSPYQVTLGQDGRFVEK